MCIAAGTPNRLCKLADGGALRLDRLAHVVLDVQLDVKQRSVCRILWECDHLCWPHPKGGLGFLAMPHLCV